jgi:hypothetical protein
MKTRTSCGVLIAGPTKKATDRNGGLGAVADWSEVKSGMNSAGSNGTRPGAPCSRQRTWADYEFFECFH